jgi:hypothetical protein
MPADTPVSPPASVLAVARDACRKALAAQDRSSPMFAERLAHDITAAVYPLIRAGGAAAERECLSAAIPPEQFRKMADWFDVDDMFKTTMFPGEWPPGSRGDAVQRNLRRFADLLESGASAPAREDPK